MIKQMWNNPISRKAIMGIGIFILLIIFIMIIASCSGGSNYTYENLEDKMVTLAKEYYTTNKSSLPKKNKDTVTLSLQTLINEKKIKSTDKITKNKSVCTGEIKVINNNGYYLYVPTLNCGKDYKTKTLTSIVTDSKNIVTSGNGLYQTTNGYIYKGDNVNNYLMLNNKTYRIINITSDNNVRVVDLTKSDTIPWDDRYNIDKASDYGINNYISNSINSRIKDSIETLYKNDEAYPKDIKAYFSTTSICIGKRSVNDTTIDGTTECSEHLDNQVFSLLQANEFYLPSLDPNCSTTNNESCANYNYMTSSISTWTITADKDTSYKVFKINSNGLVLGNASSYARMEIVANLDQNVLYQSGTGTLADPYIIKTFIEK